MEEFKDFNKYVAYIESQGAHRAGLAKVGDVLVPARVSVHVHVWGWHMLARSLSRADRVCLRRGGFCAWPGAALSPGFTGDLHGPGPCDS